MRFTLYTVLFFSLFIGADFLDMYGRTALVAADAVLFTAAGSAIARYVRCAEKQVRTRTFDEANDVYDAELIRCRRCQMSDIGDMARHRI